LWKYQPPWFFDEFDRIEEVFPAASYQYVLYGMGFRTEVSPDGNAGTRAMASNYMKEAVEMTRKLRSMLPKNRELLQKIQEYGLQPI
jgi:tryptophan halogenase